MANKQDVLEEILAEFEKLTQIPRKSGHEEKVSNYLRDRLTGLGFTVVQDEKFNIIADKPASAGCEKAPLTILQGHMDMVCVAAPGVKFDPLTDAIKLKRGKKYLEADGTSLGADDGIGVAEAIYIMRTLENHGPLRLIVTVDEEQGMTGAIHLDAKYLTDASFLINCDSENYDELTVGSAGSVNIDFSRKMQQQAPQQKKAWKLSVKDLLGGHSGERIGDGRGNAIRTAAMALLSLQEKEIAFELADFQGGTARNAIPASAEVVFASDASEKELQAVVAETKERFVEMYGGVDPEAKLLLSATEAPAQVFAAADTAALLQLLISLHTGVYAMSQVIPGLVETSANLGVIHTQAGTVTIQFFPRSAIDAKTDEFRRMAQAYAAMSGFAAQIGTQSPGWKERKDSRLARIMAETFQEQNGSPMKVETIHAGLECGWHFRKNPKLDMVSIGVTTMDIHSPNEKLLLETVEPQAALIMETLRKIAAMK